MKITITFLLVAVCLVAISQPVRVNNRVIFVKIKEAPGYLKVGNNSIIRVRVSNGTRLTGRVKEIKGDTVFMADTSVRVADIDTLFTKGKHRTGFNLDETWTMIYSKGSVESDIIVPPAEVFKNYMTYRAYYSRLFHAEKKVRLKYTDTLQYGNFIKMNVAKLFHLELSFSYERRITKKLTWETELSAIYGIPDTYLPSVFQIPVLNYSGFTITTYPKYYLFNPEIYLSAVFMYRYLWVAKMRADWPDDRTTDYLQDQYRNDFGLSLRIGVTKQYRHFVADYYFGLGAKYVMVHQLIYGSYTETFGGWIHYTHEDHSADTYNKVFIKPVINAGIKLGFGF